MANIVSAKKRAKQAEVRRQRNASQRSAVRTQVKSLVKMIEKGDVTAAKAAFPTTASALDKAARKGLIHRNTAARGKSRLNKRIKGLVTASA